MPFSTHKITGHAPFECFVYAPEDMSPDLPIVVYLHGSGERGHDPALMLQEGVGEAFEKRQPQAIVLFPQCTPEFRLFYGDMEKRVLDAIAYAVNELDGDPTRVTGIGYSMGATSCLFLQTLQPQTFAAIASIAAGISYPEKNWPVNLPDDEFTVKLFDEMFVSEDRARNIAYLIYETPVWFMHGDEDTACPIDEVRSLAYQLDKLGMPPRFTEYAGVEHDSLLRALDEPELFDWLLSHKQVTASV